MSKSKMFIYLRTTLKTCVVLWSGILALVEAHYMVDRTNVLEDKALHGYAFRNFTMKTNTVNECFLHCYEDCSCMTFQIFKNTECQLLSSNRFQTPSALVTTKGCSYYDMLPPKSQVGFGQTSSCTHQCKCSVNPCRNGGRCDSFFPKDYTTHRFKCNCSPGYAGEFCEDVVKSCRGYINGSRVPGKYKMFGHNMNLFEVFCDFDSNSNMAWTLVQSYQQENNTFKSYEYGISYPVNEDSPRWDEYRLSKSKMQSIQKDSVKWRITCKYETDGVVYRDYLQASNNQLDIMTFNNQPRCPLVEWIDVRGQSCKQCTAFLVQGSGLILHADSYFSKSKGCEFQTADGKLCGGVSGEDNFGYYYCSNSAHRCSSSPSATTQTWFGSQ